MDGDGEPSHQRAFHLKASNVPCFLELRYARTHARHPTLCLIPVTIMFGICVFVDVSFFFFSIHVLKAGQNLNS